VQPTTNLRATRIFLLPHQASSSFPGDRIEELGVALDAWGSPNRKEGALEETVSVSTSPGQALSKSQAAGPSRTRRGSVLRTKVNEEIKTGAQLFLPSASEVWNF